MRVAAFVTRVARFVLLLWAVDEAGRVETWLIDP
jgi:hypothetical protein